MAFDACPDVLDHLKTEALRRVGPWGLDGGPAEYADGRGGLLGAQDDAAGDLAAPESTAGAGGHSTTNVQEAGVDEPDIVKTDGELMVTVINSTLRVIDVRDGTPEQVGELPLAPDDGFADASVLLHDDHALVLVRDDPMVVHDAPTAAEIAPSVAGIAPRSVPPVTSTTALMVDLSDPSSPTVESRLNVDGSYLDARVVGDTVRLVVSSAPSLEFPMDEKDWNLDEDELTARNNRNKTTVAESDIDDWLPSYRLTVGDDESSGRLVECDRLRRPEDFTGFSTISVLTLPFGASLSAGAAEGVLTGGDTVYASSERLYVATNQWSGAVPLAGDAVMPRNEDVQTDVHAFDISGAEPASYVGSGSVDGTIIGRYAMSEHEGVLRIATTDGSPWDEQQSSESQLITLAERDGKLVELGRVGGLGKGEQIYAVRYFGPTAYVVTFRQTDPLYTVDLSNPEAPAVTGELKITGYSSYLHQVGEGRLVGVGQEATAEGQAVGAQVALFDVTDPRAPAKLDGHVVPGTWTEAESDPHAFLYWADTSQLVVPIAGEGAEGALVLRVDGNDLAEQGKITRADESSPDYWYGSAKRSIVVGDLLYTLWDDGLQANDLDDLQLRDWLPMPLPGSAGFEKPVPTD